MCFTIHVLNLKPVQNNKPSPDGAESLVNQKDIGSTSVGQTSETIESVEKPIKPEELPFEIFINEYLIPSLEQKLNEIGVKQLAINFIYGPRPVVGGECWTLICELEFGRRFWLCFGSDKISSNKTIAIAESDSEPSLLESFLIDERKTTLALLVSRIIQRLNGQKWLGAN